MGLSAARSFMCCQMIVEQPLIYLPEARQNDSRLGQHDSSQVFLEKTEKPAGAGLVGLGVAYFFLSKYPFAASVAFSFAIKATSPASRLLAMIRIIWSTGVAAGAFATGVFGSRF